MKSIKFVLSVLTLLTFAVVFSGAVNAQCITLEEVSVPESVSHNQGDFDVTFKIANGGGNCLERTGLVWEFESTLPGMTWDEPTLESILPSDDEEITTTFTFPEHKNGNIALTIYLSTNEDGNRTVSLELSEIEITNEPDLEITLITEITENQDGVIEVENLGNVDFTNVQLTRLSGDFEVEFSDDEFALTAGQSKPITVTPIDLGVNVGFGGKSVTIEAKAEDNTKDTIVMAVTGSFCDAGIIGTSNMSVTIDDISNRGDSDDSEDDVWVLGDEIEVEIDVDNLMDNDDLRDIVVELGFFDPDGKNVADDLDFESGDEKIDLGRINEDDTETATFKFRVPPDFDAGDYRLVVKAYDDVDEDELCVEEEESGGIDVRFEGDVERFIIVDDIMLDNTDLICGEVLSGDFTVFNIGDEIQERVRIILQNKQLGIDEEFEITNDFDEGEDENFQFSFELPTNIKPDRYSLQFYTEYEYNNGIYETRSQDRWNVYFDVISCAGYTGDSDGGDKGNALISVTQSSDAMPGEDFTVIAQITNLGAEEALFVVDLANYQSWASLVSISDTALTLGPGESDKVEIVFSVEEDASGDQTFTIQTISGQNIETRDVQVTIEGESTNGGFFTGLSIGNLGESGFVWLLVLINVILIILIIIVAVRITRH